MSDAVLDEFSRQLFSAIDARDLARIRELQAQGARLDHPNPDYLRPNRDSRWMRVTPAAYAAVDKEWKADDLEDLLGRKNKEVMTAAVFPDGERLNLYQAVPLQSSTIDFEMVLIRLGYCFDHASPPVIAAMWDGAIMAADRMYFGQGRSSDDPCYKECAEKILKDGVYATSNQKYAELLSKQTGVTASEAGVLRFVDEPICANKTILANWLNHGMCPNLHIEGMPLLHYMAINNRVDAIGCLLDAGADLNAACTYARLGERLDPTDRTFLAPLDRPVTALDAAREARAGEAAQAIESYMAKRRIDAVLSAAKARVTP